ASSTQPHSSASLDSPLNHNKLLNILFSSEQNLDSSNSSSQNSSRSDFKNLPRLYTCKICNNSFKKSTHLSRHVRTHTGDKPFQCKYCPKAFARSDNLLVHERIHTGDKPFSCEICGRLFNTRSDRNRHISIHNDIDPERLNFLLNQK
uniref:C2H2-type domain-containing protein n=1 Tax=Acrobeloides nanus TaxID=290746 RepID=A0A914CN27_9BILA